MKAYLKKVFSYILTAAMILTMLPMHYAAATEPLGPIINLGSESFSNGKYYYSDAMVFGDNIRTVLISFSDSVTSGDAIILPAAPAGFTVSTSSANNNYTKRINLDAGIAAGTVRDYIRGIGFSIASPAQTVQITISTESITQDTFYYAGTGHYYQFIPDTSSSWVQAYSNTKTMAYMGRAGYLATITSLGEDTFVNSLSGKTGWLGGTILTNTGTSDGSLYYNGFNTNSVVSSGWYWACGPEKGTTFYNINSLYPNQNDTTFINQQDNTNATYFNWTRDPSGEPNNRTASALFFDGFYETCLSTLKNSYYTGKHGTAFTWNDIRYDFANTDTWHANGYFVEYGDQSIGDSGSTSDTFAIGSGTLERPYTATVNNRINGVPAAALGSVELKQGGTTVCTLSSGATGVYTAPAANGTYDIYIKNEDTGADITISGADNNAAVNYYSVSFAVSNTNAPGSTISATAGGSSITSGTAVLSGKAVTITANGAGADSYTYAWSGSGTNGETTSTINIPTLGSAVNALCTVTGTTAPVTYAADIYTATDGVYASAPGLVELKQGGVTFYTAAAGGTAGLYTVQAVDGTYNIYINHEDTGKNIIIGGTDAGVQVDYYTVSFSAKDEGTSSGSTVSATAGGSSITSGTAVLSGKAVTITANGAGADSYTYAWSGSGTSGETASILTIPALGSAVNALCTVTGTTAPVTYAADIYTATDGVYASAPGLVELKQGGVTVYTAAAGGTAGLYTVQAVDGTYDIYVNHEDTGENIIIGGTDAGVQVDYYTVSYAVMNAGTSSGSTVSATAGGSSITSGTAVLSGKAVTITATGAGADSFTYAWSGSGTNGETTSSITIPTLGSAVNALCTVTGTTAPVTYAADIYTATDGVYASAPGLVELKQGGVTVYTAAAGGTAGLYTVQAVDGTYDIYINHEDTGENIIIGGTDAGVQVNYYTVSFAVMNAGTASGSTVSATAGGSSITSGTAVLSGKAVTITANGAGADSFTYAWSGSGTSGETASILTIPALGSAVNALCTITGTAETFAPGTLEEEAGDTTIIADGLFMKDARLYIIPIPEGETDREELESMLSDKQTAAAFEVHIEPADAFKAPLTLSFQLGEQYNGRTVYILHKLGSGSVEQYTVKVTNGEAVITVSELSPFLLTVDPPVAITAQPQSVTVVTGQTATFTVTAAGTGPLTYQWQKRTGANASWEDISGAVDASHTTSQANLSNSGFRYRVIVTDAYGRSVQSEAAALTVTKAPEAPATGDRAQPALYMALIILFMLSTVLLLRRRKAV